MKIKALMCVGVIYCLSTIAYAAPLFQAGNITEGKKWTIDAGTGVASYYAEGITGKIQFNCDLQGNPGVDNAPIKAYLRTGKNFDNIYNLPITPLTQGINGPFIWTLTNENTDVGNIKIFYTSGSNMTVQCVGGKIQTPTTLY